MLTAVLLTFFFFFKSEYIIFHIKLKESIPVCDLMKAEWTHFI